VRIKQIIFGILIVSAAALLAMPAKSREIVPRDRVVVTYWEKWTGREADQMKQIVDWFNDSVGKEKNIWVSYISMSQIDQKTLVASAAGVPPDVSGVWQGPMEQFSAIDALEPLDDLAAAHGITRDYYKPVYWEMCFHDGHLFALPSTPATIALHWNKKIFIDHAAQLQAAGLDPSRPPRTLQELDRYAHVLDDWQGGRLIRAGYLPQEPGWYLQETPYWFGAEFYDPVARKLKMTDPQFVAAFEWIRSYTTVLGKDQMQDFRSGMPGQYNFDTPANPFLTGTVAMVQQGPWMANFIEKLNPAMNHWHPTAEELKYLPPGDPKNRFMWGVAAFPSAVPGLENVSFADIDTLVIPRGSKHKNEAFEFMAFVNRQDVMEKLCSMHCKNSPLAKESDEFIRNHPNPYIDVFEKLAASPNARGMPKIPTWPELFTDLGVLAEKVYLLQDTPEHALNELQNRMQIKLDQFYALQDARKGKS
jgi:multiple sugar transport system substrate-binding protein